MQKKYDLKLSKRPILEPDQNDILSMQKRIERIEEEVEKAEADIELREKNPDYIKLIRESEQRMLEIAVKRMSLDVKDIAANAEVIGQFNERIYLTEQLLNVKNDIIQKQSWLKQAKERLTKLVNKTAERLSHAITRS